MRFVVPETVRIDLKDSVDSQGNIVKNWISIKKELSKGEDAQMRSGGLKRMSQGADDKTTEIGVDWQALALSRVTTYLVDWSAKDANGKDIRLTPSAIAELAPEDFEEIDDAIKKHMEEMDAEKKARAGASRPATTSS